MTTLSIDDSNTRSPGPARQCWCSTFRSARFARRFGFLNVCDPLTVATEAYLRRLWLTDTPDMVPDAQHR